MKKIDLYCLRKPDDFRALSQKAVILTNRGLAIYQGVGENSDVPVLTGHFESDGSLGYAVLREVKIKNRSVQLTPKYCIFIPISRDEKGELEREFEEAT